MTKKKHSFFSSIIKKVSIFFLGIGILFLFLIRYTKLSPKLSAWTVKKLFEGGMAVPPENYDELLAKTRSMNDVDYNSRYTEGKLDIIFPIEDVEKAPVIFWVHGGAYVGSDKSDITEYGVQMAANGYVVVNMNYGLAPKEQYPTPLYQIDEAYQYITRNAEKYGINVDDVYFAGDSAGAQIVAQYVNIQIDEAYAKKMNIEAVVDHATIRGALLFCGPYNLQKLDQIESGKIVQFFMEQVGWAYIGARDWKNQPQTELAAVTNYVTGNYPPTFITDGNVGSFEEHGKELAEILRKKGVDVDTVFYDKSTWELGHEYQFLMNTEAAQQTFEKVITFLNKTH